MELIKKTISVGNSAGVLLPKKYLNSEVKIILTPLNVEKDTLNILLKENLLKETLGAYVVGSYARKEENIDSDIDIIVITTKTDKIIKSGKYEIILISKESLERQLENNIMPLLPMISEAKTIINEELINNYKKTKLTNKNLKPIIEITNSGLKMCKSALDLEKELNSKYGSDAIAYSLVLNLRTLYIIDKLIKKESASKEELINIIKKITKSRTAYDRYSSVKTKNKREKKLPIKEADELYIYINKKLIELKIWLKTKKE